MILDDVDDVAKIHDVCWTLFYVGPVDWIPAVAGHA
jgi:hypothetical protein